ncbi:MAG: V-type ATPase subunit [Clostridiales bacterium]|jgi:V/A-type H+-transporting ATPase subunit C|nr:V-type ATPase subunit [Clostridiales bacterium]
MPQSSHLFAVARVRALEKNLIGGDGMHRIAYGTLEEGMRVLRESGYGGMPDATDADCERMIANELLKTAKLIEEITPDKEATDLFLLRADVHNIKALLKQRLLGSADAPALLNGGVYDTARLSACVRDQQYRDLPEAFKDALNALEKELAAAPSPKAVSVALDSAYQNHARAVIAARHDNDPFLSDYFYGLADFDNVLALLRLRDMGARRDELKAALLPAGDVPHGALLNAFEQPLETLSKLVATGRAGFAIAAGLSEKQRTGHTSPLEKARDNYLIGLIKKYKYDSMTLWPVLGYYLAREQEAKSIRLIITVKRNGLDEGVITERLRELYG